MQKFVFLFAVLVAMLSVMPTHAQWEVFRGNEQYLTERVIFKYNERVFPNESYALQDAMYTIIGNKIMEGASGSEFDLIYEFREGKLYRARGMSSVDIVYTFENGKIYKGNSNFALDVLYNVKNNVIYPGIHPIPIDALYVIRGKYNEVDLFAVLLSLGLIR